MWDAELFGKPMANAFSLLLVGLYYCISRLPDYCIVGTLSKFLAIVPALV